MLNELASVKNALSVLVLALVLALYLFANSPFFETDHIEWTGLVNLSSEQLDAHLNPPGDQCLAFGYARTRCGAVEASLG